MYTYFIYTKAIYNARLTQNLKYEKFQNKKSYFYTTTSCI